MALGWSSFWPGGLETRRFVISVNDFKNQFSNGFWLVRGMA
jgi:hypothetical protein